MILERLRTGSGEGFTIYSAPGVKDEIAGLDSNVKGPMVAILNDVAVRGTRTMLKSQVNALGDGIFELKPLGSRLLFFYLSGSRAVVVAGVVKKQKWRMPPREIKNAKRIRRLVEEAQREGQLYT